MFFFSFLFFNLQVEKWKLVYSNSFSVVSFSLFIFKRFIDADCRSLALQQQLLSQVAYYLRDFVK